MFNVRVETQDNKQTTTGLQTENSNNFHKRSKSLLAKLFSSRKISGEEHRTLKNCYMISIMEYKLFKEHDDFIYDYRY
jgi:hypothetical protein